MTVGLRIALIDSCGCWPGASEAIAFADDGAQVERLEPAPDPSGHGSRVAQLLTGCDAAVELLLAQVFLDAQPASAAAVAAHAGLIHMSLGLAADREVLSAAVARAVGRGCLIVAAMPARGALVYPAGYAGVIRGTGDARCAPGELSHLGDWLYGGCPRFDAATLGKATSAVVGGASIGAAWVTRSILNGPQAPTASGTVEALTAMTLYQGPEARGRPS